MNRNTKPIISYAEAQAQGKFLIVRMPHAQTLSRYFGENAKPSENTAIRKITDFEHHMALQRPNAYKKCQGPCRYNITDTFNLQDFKDTLFENAQAGHPHNTFIGFEGHYMLLDQFTNATHNHGLGDLERGLRQRDKTITLMENDLVIAAMPYNTLNLDGSITPKIPYILKSKGSFETVELRG